MKFRKSHIWLILLTVGGLMLLLQLGGIVGGYDTELMNQAMAIEGEAQNTAHQHKVTRQQLEQTKAETLALRNKLPRHAAQAHSPQAMKEEIKKRIVRLKERLQKRNQ
ncbi:MAG: hypothetical protein IKJ29_04490 [Akkermansia sp.]|nr:hypothetical protein [Akkermansia sp.]